MPLKQRVSVANKAKVGGFALKPRTTFRTEEAAWKACEAALRARDEAVSVGVRVGAHVCVVFMWGGQ